jgi:hypothetical protein
MHSTLQPTRVYVEYPLNTLPQGLADLRSMEEREPQGLLQGFTLPNYIVKRRASCEAPFAQSVHSRLLENTQGAQHEVNKCRDMFRT